MDISLFPVSLDNKEFIAFLFLSTPRYISSENRMESRRITPRIMGLLANFASSGLYSYICISYLNFQLHFRATVESKVFQNAITFVYPRRSIWKSSFSTYLDLNAAISMQQLEESLHYTYILSIYI